MQVHENSHSHLFQLLVDYAHLCLVLYTFCKDKTAAASHCLSAHTGWCLYWAAFIINRKLVLLTECPLLTHACHTQRLTACFCSFPAQTWPKTDGNAQEENSHVSQHSTVHVCINHSRVCASLSWICIFFPPASTACGFSGRWEAVVCFIVICVCVFPKSYVIPSPFFKIFIFWVTLKEFWMLRTLSKN